MEIGVCRDVSARSMKRGGSTVLDADLLLEEGKLAETHLFLPPPPPLPVSYHSNHSNQNHIPQL
jgi:hypothetical protein